jgi:curved DNA-binding protein CbpA
VTEKVPRIAANSPGRRSTRIDRAVPLSITWQDASGNSFSEETFTSSINCHGCRCNSRFRVRKNAKITVQVDVTGGNSSDAERSFPARVAWIEVLRPLAGLYRVGIEFATPQDHWRVGDAPEDWNRFSSTDQDDPVSLLNEVERLLQFARVGAHYQILGLQPDTTRLEVKRRFYQLARRFHPDRHMDHPSWAPRLLLLMNSITTAYKTLSADGAKKAYDSDTGATEVGQAGAVARLLARECLEKAQECVAAKNYVGSILWLHRAIEAEPQSSRYRTMLGRSLAAIPEYRHEAVEQYEKALRLDPRNVSAHFQYAQLLEQLKFPLRARPHYLRVLELDPRHRQARQRLNDLDVANPRSVLRSALLNRLKSRR